MNFLLAILVITPMVAAAASDTSVVASMEEAILGLKSSDQWNVFHRGLAYGDDDECEDEMIKAFLCETTDGCFDCFLNAVEAVPTYHYGCSDLENSLCSEYEKCERICGDCHDEMIKMNDCFLDSNLDFHMCTVDCVGYSPGSYSAGSGGSSSSSSGSSGRNVPSDNDSYSYGRSGAAKPSVVFVGALLVSSAFLLV